MAAQAREHAAQKARGNDRGILRPGGTSTAQSRMRGRRLAVILTPMSREDQLTFRDMACRANKGMVLEAVHGRGLIGHHACQNQLGTARGTTHRLHSDQLGRAERPPGATV